MRVSNQDLAFTVATVLYSGVNLYLAPVSFAISFAAGTTFGLGIGLYRKVNLLLVNANEKAANAVKERLPGVTEQASKMNNTIQNSLDQMNPVLRGVVTVVASFSKWMTVFQFASNCVTNFEDQRRTIKKNLDPIPGWKGMTLMFVTTAANLSAATYPVFSQIGVLSGFAPGYATGLYLIKPLFNPEPTLFGVVFDGASNRRHIVPV